MGGHANRKHSCEPSSLSAQSEYLCTRHTRDIRRVGVGEHMKGVVLAGGTGSRLNPLTRVTNKHLLPIYDKPMVYYPIQTLVNAGIEEILLVTGGKNAGDFLRLLGNGHDFGLKHLELYLSRRRRWNRRSAWLGGVLCRRRADLRHSRRQHYREQCSATPSKSSRTKMAARKFF